VRILTASFSTCVVLLASVSPSPAQGRNVATLLEELKSADEGQRFNAARALAHAPSPLALRRLLVCAQVDPAAKVRKACAAAVLILAPRSFASKLGSADPSPVAEPRYPLRPRARYATLFCLGLSDNALEAPESLAGSAAFGIRWGDVEAQLTLGFPEMSLGLRVRWLVMPYPRLTPYLSLGGVVAYHEGDPLRGEAISLFGGVGLRYYIVPPIFMQLEFMVSWAAHAPIHQTRADGKVEAQRFALPVLFDVGLELWP